MDAGPTRWTVQTLTQDSWGREALDAVQGRLQVQDPFHGEASLHLVAGDRCAHRGSRVVRVHGSARRGWPRGPFTAAGASPAGTCERRPICPRAGAGSVSALARWPDGMEATHS